MQDFRIVYEEKNQRIFIKRAKMTEEMAVQIIEKAIKKYLAKKYKSKQISIPTTSPQTPMDYAGISVEDYYNK